MNFLFTKIFPLFCVSLLVIRLNAQSFNPKFDHIGLERGLSQSTITAIAQDKQGFIWFGTGDGLNRYDGYSMKVFKNDPNDSNSISDNQIFCLLSDSKGDLWIGTQKGGLNRFVVTENKFYHFTKKLGSDSINVGNYIVSLLEDSNKDIWIGTRGNGLIRFNRSDSTFTQFLNNPKDSTSINSNTIMDITKDNSGSIWIATNRGLAKLKKGNNGKEYFQRFLGSRMIFKLETDNDETIWIGAIEKGLLRFNTSDNILTNFNIIPDSKYSELPNAIVGVKKDTRGNLWVIDRDAGLFLFDSKTNTFKHYLNEALVRIFEDKSGLLWIGTFGNGVKIFDYQKNAFTHYNDSFSDVNGNTIYAIYKDNDGEIWAGSINGLKRYDMIKNKVTTYLNNPKDKNSISSNLIFSICKALDGGIWLGTLEGLNHFSKSTGKFTRYLNFIGRNNTITSICNDLSGRLWIGNADGGIGIFYPDSATFHRFEENNSDSNSVEGTFASVYEDKSGTIWVGTIGGGLYSYLPNTNSFRQHLLPAAVGNSVYSVFQNEKEILWLATLNGLIKYNLSTGSFIQYSTSNGLPNNNVYGILPDVNGNLWLSTNNGISKFNIEKEIFTNYNFEDDLKSNEFNQGAFFSKTKDELIFGGMNGFYSFKPSEILENKIAPPVYITTFKVFNETLPLPSPLADGSNISLSFNQNFFSFEFVALNYIAADKNQYAYKLEGFDNDWHKVSSTQRYASYTNLDPGEYTLRVIASNNHGVWNNKGTSIIITITPPFWMTWWFRILIVLTLAGAIYFFFRLRLERRLEMERLRIKIAADLHDDIGAALTRVSLESELLKSNLNTEDRKLSIERIGSMSRDIITSMSDIVWSIDSRNDSIENLINRMKDFAYSILSPKNVRLNFEINKLDMQKKLKVDIRQNIYLIFKESLNNMVKYSHSEILKVSMQNSDGNFIMVIDDPQTSFNPEKLTGHGLRNMKMRAERIGGKIEFVTSNGLKTIFTCKEL